MFSTILIEQFLRTSADALEPFVTICTILKTEKRLWRSVTFSKVAGFSLQLEVTFLHGCFLPYLNYTNGTKSCKASHIERKNFFFQGYFPGNDIKLMKKIDKNLFINTEG